MQRLHAKLFRHRNDLPQLLQLLNDHDDLFAELDAEQRHLDEVAVLVAVAYNQVADFILQRQPGEQFRLAADFQPEIIRLARVENFLHHFAELVHLHRKHAAIPALVAGLGDGTAERLIDGLDAMPQNILEADQQRKFQPARLGLLDYVRDVHRRARVLQRLGDDVAGVVDVKILRAPALDVVKRRAPLRCPTAARWRRLNCSFQCFRRAHYKNSARESNKRNENFSRRSRFAISGKFCFHRVMPKIPLEKNRRALRQNSPHARHWRLRRRGERIAGGKFRRRHEHRRRRWTPVWRR